MATQQTATAGRALVAPSVILLFIWMIVPLVMTLYFSSCATACSIPTTSASSGLQNYASFLTDPDFLDALSSTRWSSSSRCSSSASCGGILVALLMDQPVFGQNILR